MRVLTVGTFDVLHVGHLELLDACADLVAGAGELIVGLNTDDFIERYRGRAPVLPYSERFELLEALEVVDRVVPNDQPNGTMFPLIEHLRPAALVVGSDWLERDYLAQIGCDPHAFETLRCQLIYTPRTRGRSSTGVKALLEALDG